jgi:hypothetical protein
MSTIPNAPRGLLIGLLLLPGPCLAGDTESVPDACRLGDVATMETSATMACYAALDTDGDAALSPAEADALPRLRGRFDELDVDGSGALGPAEFQADLHTPSQLGGGKGI